MLAREERLDLLVNNAGALPMAASRTADGTELARAVNHLAPFLLTARLLPLLRASPAPRVVDLTSSAVRPARLRPQDVGAEPPFSPMRTYGRAKLAALAATAEWAERLRPAGVVVHAADPGGADPSMTRAMTREAMPAPLRALFPLFERVGPRSRPAVGAARSTLVACAAPELGQVTGRLVTPRGTATAPPRRAADPALRAAVWEHAAGAVGLAPEAVVPETTGRAAA